LKETIYGEANNAGHDKEPRIRPSAQYGSQATHRATDNTNVVDQTATKSMAQNETNTNSITNCTREHNLVSAKRNLRIAHLSKYK